MASARVEAGPRYFSGLYLVAQQLQDPFGDEASDIDLRYWTSRLADDLADAGCTATIVGALDQIAWVFNLRGSDIECNPVFLSYAVVKLRAPAGADAGAPSGRSGERGQASQVPVASSGTCTAVGSTAKIYIRIYSQDLQL